jgi:ribosomal protein S18 acetylase RimI-like enzyme
MEDSISPGTAASPFVISGGELPLSNPGQLELLRGMLERGVSLRMTARGFSMTPFIRDNDVLTIAPLNGREPRLGEVLAFTLPDSGRLAVHRLIARKEDGWLMRGDNSSQPDGIIPGGNVLGIVTHIERGSRSVRFGLGIERALIAILNQGRALLFLKALWTLPLRIAAGVFYRVQALLPYRRFARRIARDIQVLEASPQDLERALRHLNPGGSFPVPSPDPNRTDFVAKIGGRIAGFVQYVFHPKEDFPWCGHWLFSLEVWGLYRGLGIGERLTRRVIDQALAKGATELLLAVFEDNQRAIRLYNKLGFDPIVLPELEDQFMTEKQEYGRRRIILSKRLERGS